MTPCPIINPANTTTYPPQPLYGLSVIFLPQILLTECFDRVLYVTFGVLAGSCAAHTRHVCFLFGCKDLRLEFIGDADNTFKTYQAQKTPAQHLYGFHRTIDGSREIPSDRNHTNAFVSQYGDSPKPFTAGSFTTTAAPEGKDDLRILVHASLIQEWHLFLDAVFCDVTLFCLRSDMQSRLPNRTFRLNVRLPEIKAGYVSELRTSIMASLRDAFSFESYPEKINVLHGIFNISPVPPSAKHLRKHVVVRNVFQHNRGIIRDSDLSELGGHNLEIKDDSGEVTSYTADDRLVLSLGEIKDLKQAISDHSKLFEVFS